MNWVSHDEMLGFCMLSDFSGRFTSLASSLQDFTCWASKVTRHTYNLLYLLAAVRTVPLTAIPPSGVSVQTSHLPSPTLVPQNLIGSLQ